MQTANWITFEDRLISSGRRPSGFDYLRLILAVCVVLSHTSSVAYGMKFTQTLFDGPMRAVIDLILPLFFALSGFLVAGSLERCRTLVSFIGLRFIRLIPALVVETTLAAILIGIFFTNLPLKEYFSSPLLFKYAYNVIGHVQYFLPGVFDSNPTPGIVNIQLWTLPYELICYVLISILVLFGIASHRVLFFSTIVIINVILLSNKIITGDSLATRVVPGVVLVLSFLYGIAFYLFRGRIVWSRSLFVASTLITMFFLLPQFRPWGDYLIPLSATYVTVYLGLLQPKRIKILLTGDYSYGIFLYGFPIQQAVVATMGSSGQFWYINFIVSMPIILAIAALSWWFIEKPSLNLRTTLLRIEDFVIQFFAKKFSGKINIFYKFHALESAPKKPLK